MTKVQKAGVAVLVAVALIAFAWWVVAAIGAGDSHRQRRVAWEETLAAEYQIVETRRVDGAPLASIYIMRGMTRTGSHYLVVTSSKLWFVGDWIRVNRLDRTGMRQDAFSVDPGTGQQTPVYGLSFEKAP